MEKQQITIKISEPDKNGIKNAVAQLFQGYREIAAIIEKYQKSSK